MCAVSVLLVGERVTDYVENISRGIKVVELNILYQYCIIIPRSMFLGCIIIIIF